MNKKPIIITANNITTAWMNVLGQTVAGSGTEITPLLVNINGFDESANARKVLDDDLERNNFYSIDTVSETIFPKALYLYCDNDRQQLFEEYTKILPWIKEIDKNNNKGTYFQRLIAYDNNKNNPINQLEIIISSLLNKNVKRRSKLQASIFDPKVDHTGKAYQGFPCLQHISLYRSSSGGLILNSVYAIQLLYKKAYGNWLGLINLGEFIAEQVGTELEEFNCFIGVEQLGVTKEYAKKLQKQMQSEL